MIVFSSSLTSSICLGVCLVRTLYQNGDYIQITIFQISLRHGQKEWSNIQSIATKDAGSRPGKADAAIYAGRIANHGVPCVREKKTSHSKNWVQTIPLALLALSRALLLTMLSCALLQARSASLYPSQETYQQSRQFCFSRPVRISIITNENRRFLAATRNPT